MARIRSVLLGTVTMTTLAGCYGSSSPEIKELIRQEFTNTVDNTKAISQVMDVADFHAKGTTGAGTLVAIVDTGIATDVPGLVNRISEDSIQIATSTRNITDKAGHGTRMASIIASEGSATGLVGMAPGAELLVVRADRDDNPGVPYVSLVTKGIKYAAEHDADVINLSLYSNDRNIINEINNAVTSGSIVVVATGNTGRDGDPGRIAYEVGNYGDRAVAVTAVTSRNEIASFAAPCAVANPRFCVAAPGVNIQTIDQKGLEGPASGTSAATAVVSGGIALMRQYFPNLDPSEIVEILLETAQDLGEAGVDPVYGSGLVDFEAALRPVGTVTVSALPEGTALAQSVAVTGAAFGDGLVQVAALKSLQIKDGYGRDYRVNAQSWIAPRQEAFDDVDLLTDMRISTAETNFGPLALAYSSISDSPLTDYVEDDWFFSMSMETGDQSALHFATTNTRRDMSAAQYNFYSVQSDPMKSPFPLLGERFTSLGFDSALQLGQLKTRVELIEQDETGKPSTLISVGFETLSLNGFRGSATLSALNEPGSVLGARFSGAFGEIANGRSVSATLGAAYDGEWYDLFLSGSLGKSSVDMKRAGLISGFNDITFSHWNFGMGFDAVLTRDDRLSIGFGQPIRIEGGKARFFEGSQHSLRPSGRELNAELTYRATIDNTQFAAGMLYGHNIGNIAGQSGQFQAAIFASHAF